VPVYRRKQTKSKHWYFKFEINGVVYKETVPTARTKRQAEEAQLVARQELHEGKYSKAKPILFSDFVKTHYLPWAEKHHAKSDTDKTITDMLCEHFKSETVSQISPMGIEGFKIRQARRVSQYDRPYAAGTINLALAHLSGILNMAVRYEFIRKNPCKGIKGLPAQRGRLRYLLPEEETILMNACEKSPGYLRPLIQLAIWTGFRQGELLRLQRCHIDFGRNLIFVANPKWKKDPRKTEGFPMSQQVRELVARLCEHDPLFNQGGRPLTRSAADNVFRRACVRAGILDLNFHALRHTFGTRLGDRDVNLKRSLGSWPRKHKADGDLCSYDRCRIERSGRNRHNSGSESFQQGIRESGKFFVANRMARPRRVCDDSAPGWHRTAPTIPASADSPHEDLARHR